MTRRISSRRVILTATFLGLAAGGLAACDSTDDNYENEDGVFYCTDVEGRVVDEDFCDDSGDAGSSGFFFMYMGSSLHHPPAGYSTYPVGHKLPPNTPKFSVTDKAARAKFGLPTSGKINNGTVKTGVVGKSGGKVGGGYGGKGTEGGKSGGG